MQRQERTEGITKKPSVSASNPPVRTNRMLTLGSPKVPPVLKTLQ